MTEKSSKKWKQTSQQGSIMLKDVPWKGIYLYNFNEYRFEHAQTTKNKDEHLMKKIVKTDLRW